MRKPSVHVYAKSGYLYYRFTWQGITCSEFPELPDTPKNRKYCGKKAAGMTSEMDDGKFDYSYWFPNGKKKHIFLGRPDNNVTFQIFGDAVWLPHIRTKVRPETAEDYRKILEVSVYPQIGGVLLKSFRPDHCDRFILHLQRFRWHRRLPINAQEIEGRPLSPRRINIILLRVRQVLDLAFQRKYFDDNPHDWISLQEETLPDIDPLSFEERALFLDCVPMQWKRYFIVAFDTGMRPSEQLGLEWPNIDYAHKKIVIRKGVVRGEETNLKTKASRREIDMLPMVETALMGQPKISRYVFANEIGGPLDLANLRNRIWYPTLKRADLKPRDLYQVRHTFASLMLQAGEDPAWIARMMGHSNTRMLFERYAKWIRNRTRQDGSAYMQALKGGH
jgi:integrase